MNGPASPQDPDPRLFELFLDTASFDDFLHALAAAALEHAPAAQGCGITLHRRGHPLTVTSAGQGAALLDEVQYGLDQGPCLHALRHDEEVHVPDFTQETRWGPYPAHAIEAGTHSSLSLPLTPRTGLAGALNLYAPAPHAFDTADRPRLRHLAMEAAGALSLAHHLAERHRLAEELRQALTAHAIINQAAGITMAQQHCNSDQALSALQHAAHNRRMPLDALCDRVVIDRTGPPFPDDTPRLGR